jgi:hypothetical protein
MADGDEAREVERLGRRELPKVIRSRGHVEKRARPPSAFVSHPPVLEAPGGHPLAAKGVTEATRVREVVPRSPAAAVEHDRDRVWPASRGEAKLSILEGIVAVRNSGVGLGVREIQNVVDVEDAGGMGRIEGAKGVVIQSMAALETLRLERHPVTGQERGLLPETLLPEERIAASADHGQLHPTEAGEIALVQIVGKE